jgi:hypothetical protein
MPPPVQQMDIELNSKGSGKAAVLPEDTTEATRECMRASGRLAVLTVPVSFSAPQRATNPWIAALRAGGAE